MSNNVGPAPERNAVDAAGRLGTTIAGKYEVDSLIATGGMGAVYRATHVFTRGAIALKVLHSRFVDDFEGVERFLREARAVSKLDHPGIVRVLDAGQDGAQVYLALEYLDGADLGQHLEDRSLDQGTIVQITVQVLAALSAAHAAGIVHRDIKPSNVLLLEGSGQLPAVKLLDFGVAKEVAPDIEDGLTIEGTIVGTPSFMSPEQARGEAVDQRSDLWSVGALMYRALTGRPPFQAPTTSQLIAAIIRDDVSSVRTRCPEVPDALAAVVDRALSRDVTERFQTAREMQAALLSAVNPAPSVSGGDSRPHRSARERSSSRRRALGLLAIVALVLAGGVALHERSVARDAGSPAERPSTTRAPEAVQPVPPPETHVERVEPRSNIPAAQAATGSPRRVLRRPGPVQEAPRPAKREHPVSKPRLKIMRDYE